MFGAQRSRNALGFLLAILTTNHRRVIPTTFPCPGLQLFTLALHNLWPLIMPPPRRSRSRSPERHSRKGHSHSHRTRSRSPQRDRDHHRRKRHRTRSPSPRPVVLPYKARKLSKYDFNSYKPLFQSYLDIQKQLNIGELDEREVKGRWKSFVSRWYAPLSTDSRDIMTTWTNIDEESWRPST